MNKREKNGQAHNDKFSAEQVAEALIQSQGLISVAARRLGCTPKTVRFYMKRYKTVADARKEARNNMLDVAEGRLFTAITSGAAWAIKYFLSSQGVDRGYNLQLILAREVAKLKDTGYEDGMEDFMKSIDKLLDPKNTISQN